MRQALELALEALKSMKATLAEHDEPTTFLEDQAIAALREAIAELESQEPVAWGFKNTAITGSKRWMMLREEIPADDQYKGALWTPLYTYHSAHSY
jgi:hypothetical protein